MRTRAVSNPWFLTVTEAARRLGVSRGTVYVMIHRGQLTRRTVGLREYVPAGQVERLVLASGITKAATIGTATALVEVLKRYPELAAQLRQALGGGEDR